MSDAASLRSQHLRTAAPRCVPARLAQPALSRRLPATSASSGAPAAFATRCFERIPSSRAKSLPTGGDSQMPTKRAAVASPARRSRSRFERVLASMKSDHASERLIEIGRPATRNACEDRGGRIASEAATHSTANVSAESAASLARPMARATAPTRVISTERPGHTDGRRSADYRRRVQRLAYSRRRALTVASPSAGDPTKRSSTRTGPDLDDTSWTQS